MNNSLFSLLCLAMLSFGLPLGAQNNCPFIVDPVCGSNGVTYLNGCYAESAGITDYTPGTCYSSCIDPAQMNPSANCSQAFEPVCGCNEVTYLNACIAEANGITAYRQGACNNSDNCYDPVLVLTTSGTVLNYPEGTINLICDTAPDPVCACDGTTYLNACIAEASGITYYTSGACNNTCIDPDQMNPDANCPDSYNPVCGCNNITYGNACKAEAAGVISYSTGPCNEISTWCQEAIAVQCGDFLGNESNLGSGNQLANYPGCTGGLNYTGPDKVYLINKTTVGDLQIGMEITSPNIDLDLFLLADACNEIRCLAASTQNNDQSNFEYIILENAPIGVYYLVVDGRNPSAAGNYRLEVNCGYLKCTDAIPLSCGIPFSYSNLQGSDNVSIYSCSNNLNGENNGPEVVHSFTLTAPGPVDITLSELSANLELFLLASCDRNNCIDFSQKPGTNSESIVNYLEAGTYYIVVEGNNGATSDYTLMVNCNATCNLEISSLVSAASTCGQSTGAIVLSTSGGTSPFVVNWSGSTSGSMMTSNTSTLITGLSPGYYDIVVTDASGCISNEHTVIESNSDFEINLTSINALCDQNGSANISLFGGDPGYSINIVGPVNAMLEAQVDVFTIDNLIAGSYLVYITDAENCVAAESFTIENDNNGFSFSTNTTAAICHDPGAISVYVSGGQPQYTVHLSGPVNRMYLVNSNGFSLDQLPGGTYQLEITDLNGCTHSETVTIEEENVMISLSQIPGACGQTGSVILDISGNAPSYTISYTGPVSGNVTSSNATFLISDLPGGNYAFTVSDDQACTDFEVITVSISEGDLETDLIPIHGTCAQGGAFWIDFENGSPNYTITWTGPVNGSTSTSNAGLDIPNIPEGDYIVEITDDNGCSNIHYVHIDGDTELDITNNEQENECGGPEAINLNINNGQAPYVIVWNGPDAGYVVSNENYFYLSDLEEGLYIIDITDAEGCNTSINIPINGTGAEGEALNISGSTFEENCAGPGSILLEIEGGQTNYDIIWSGPGSGSLSSSNSTVLIDNLPAGTYQVTVTDANGCSKSETYIVQEAEVLSFTATSNFPSCQENGIISIYLTGGNPEYMIMWEGAAMGMASTMNNNFHIPGLPPGTYTISVTDGNGCVQSLTISATSPDNDLNLTVNPTDAACDQDNGRMDLFIEGGQSAYQIRWIGPNSGNITTNNTAYSISGLTAGEYTLIIVDFNGCEISQQVNIGAAGGSLDLTTNLVLGTCGSPSTLELFFNDGIPGYQINWSGPVSGSGTTSDAGYTIPNLLTGLYMITVEDANGCSATEEIDIDNAASSFGANLTPFGSACGMEGSIQVNIGGGLPGFNIEWSGPESGAVLTTQNNFIIPNLPNGQYTIRVVDGNGCVDTKETTLTNNPDGFHIVLNPNPGGCGEEGSITVEINGGVPNYSISWTGPESGVISTDQENYEIVGLISGTYVIAVTDGSGCTDQRAATLINAEGEAGISLDLTPINGACGSEGSIWLDIIGGSGQYILSWAGPESGSVFLSDDGYNIPGLPDGTYTVEVEDAEGCSGSGLITLSSSEEELSLELTPINGACGSEASIWLDILGGQSNYYISWSGPESGSVSTSDDGYNIPGLPAGQYQVTVTDANNCFTTASVTLSIAEEAFSVSINPGLAICNSTASVSLEFSGGTPNYSITWIGTENGSLTTSNISYTIPDLLPGTYVFIITDANNCTSTEMVSIQTAEQEMNIQGTPLHGGCDNPGAIALEIHNGEPGYFILWEGPVAGNVEVTENEYIIRDLPGGLYNIFVLDQNGCTQNLTVEVDDEAGQTAFVAIATEGDCENNPDISINILSGNPGFTVTWSGPESGTIVTDSSELILSNLSEGMYEVVVTDQLACAASMQQVEITAIVSDFTAEFYPIPTACGLPGSIDVIISGGEAPYNISWEGPVAGALSTPHTLYNIPQLPSGSYYVQIEDHKGCIESSPVYIDNGPEAPLEVNIMVLNGDCDGLGSLWIDFYNGNPNYFISWEGPVSGSTTTGENIYDILNLPSGTYHLLIQDISGCVYQDVFEIQNPVNDLNLQLTAQPGGCEERGSIQVEVSGGSAVYTISWQGMSAGEILTYGQTEWINDLQSGTYTVSVIDFYGCSQTAEIAINNAEGSLPDARFSFIANQLALSFNSSTPEGIHSWDFGDGGTSEAVHPEYEYTQPGTYTVCLEVSNECGADLHCEEIEVQFTQTLSPTNQEETSAYVLGQNQPNPFRETTTIWFALPEAMPAVIEVYNDLGEQVLRLPLAGKAGQNEVTLSSAGLSSGLYFYTLHTAHYTVSRKMLILK